MLERRPRRVLPVDYGPPRRPARRSATPGRAVWLEPYPDELPASRTIAPAPRPATSSARASSWRSSRRSSTCPPRQRAVLILRDVLGFSARRDRRDARHVAGRRSTAPCSGPARAVDERLPERSQQATLRALGDERRARRSSSATWTRGARPTSTRSSRCSPTTPASRCRRARRWFRGRAAIADVPADRPLARRRWRRRRDERQRPAGVRLALGCGSWADVAHAIEVLTLDAAGDAEVTAFVEHGSVASAPGQCPSTGADRRVGRSHSEPTGGRHERTRRGLVLASLGRVADGGARHARRRHRADDDPRRPAARRSRSSSGRSTPTT